MKYERRPHMSSIASWQEDHPVISTLGFTLAVFAASALIVAVAVFHG